MPDLGPLVNNSTYRPGDQEADNIPGGVPAGPYYATMADLAGKSAKGKWKLYILDDTAQDSGELLGWALAIETRPKIVFANSPPDVTIPEDALINVPFTVVDETGIINTQEYQFRFTSSDATKSCRPL